MKLTIKTIRKANDVENYILLLIELIEHKGNDVNIPHILHTF